MMIWEAPLAKPSDLSKAAKPLARLSRRRRLMPSTPRWRMKSFTNLLLNETGNQLTGLGRNVAQWQGCPLFAAGRAANAVGQRLSTRPGWSRRLQGGRANRFKNRRSAKTVTSKSSKAEIDAL